jgi:hypothetical protein
MHLCWSFLYIFVVTITLPAQADEPSRSRWSECSDCVNLYAHVTNTGGETNVWRVSMGTIKQIPLWKMDDGKPPLSMEKAIKTAKAWVISRGCERGCWVADVEICPVFATSGRAQPCYYNVLFGGVGIFGHFRRCIVLMDGTVVEPVWLYRRAPDPSESYYFDE